MKGFYSLHNFSFPCDMESAIIAMHNNIKGIVTNCSGQLRQSGGKNDGINKMLIKKIIIVNDKDFKTNVDYYGNIDSYDDLDKICKAFTEVQLDAVNSNVKY